MELMTREIEGALIERGYYPEADDWMNLPVVVKYFNPTGAGTWLIIGGEKYKDDWILFGYIKCDNDWEWGSAFLNEMRKYKGLYGLGIERDLYCKGKTVQELAKL